MAGLRSKLGLFVRDVWDLGVCHIPLRHVRRWWLRAVLGGMGEDVSVLMHVHVMEPGGVFIGSRRVVNAHCILGRRGRAVESNE